MSDKLARVEPITRELAMHHEPVFSPEQERMIRDSFMGGASKEEADVLLEIARARRLNPLLKQVHFVKRRDKKQNKDIWAVQVSIDGLRAIAERTGRYDGQDEAEYGPFNSKGYPEWARVKVYRKDWSRPAVGTAYWAEYVQTNYEGQPTRFWDSMPRVMLAKCAESIAIRKAFPEDMSGLVTPEEMMQADERPPPQISPHGHADEEPQPDPYADLAELEAKAVEAFNSIMMRMDVVEDSLPMCDSYDKRLTLRSMLGSKAKPAAFELTRDIQAATQIQPATATEPERASVVNLDQKKQIGRRWQSLDRKIEKLEKAFPAPDAADSFRDEPDESLVDS